MIVFLVYFQLPSYFLSTYFLSILHSTYSHVYWVSKLLKTHTLLIICLAIEQFIVPRYVFGKFINGFTFFVVAISSCLSCGWFRQTTRLCGRAQVDAAGENRIHLMFTLSKLGKNFSILNCGYQISLFNVNKYFHSVCFDLCGKKHVNKSSVRF